MMKRKLITVYGIILVCCVGCANKQDMDINNVTVEMVEPTNVIADANEKQSNQNAEKEISVNSMQEEELKETKKENAIIQQPTKVKEIPLFGKCIEEKQRAYQYINENARFAYTYDLTSDYDWDVWNGLDNTSDEEVKEQLSGGFVRALCGANSCDQEGWWRAYSTIYVSEQNGMSEEEWIAAIRGVYDCKQDIFTKKTTWSEIDWSKHNEELAPIIIGNYSQSDLDWTEQYKHEYEECQYAIHGEKSNSHYAIVIKVNENDDTFYEKWVVINAGNYTYFVSVLCNGIDDTDGILENLKSIKED